MPPARAADTDCQIRLPFAHIGREEETHQVDDSIDEITSLWLLEDEGTHGLVQTTHWAEVFDPMGIREEAGVEDHVDVKRDPVLEAKGHQAGPHGLVANLFAEQFEDPTSELIAIELTGIEHDVGALSDHFEGNPLFGNRVLDPRPRPWVATPCAFVAADQYVIGGVEEENPHDMGTLGQAIHRVEEVGGLPAPLPTHDECHSWGVGTWSVDQFTDSRND